MTLADLDGCLVWLIVIALPAATFIATRWDDMRMELDDVRHIRKIHPSTLTRIGRALQWCVGGYHGEGSE